ncbi:hypothetical protein IFM89_023806 [Coptis chinensis]|uniref:Enoyl reductase (ER) domain-containing protein n=1 Tax=Coptis chinensis TaxID=261450 RepID=A0A835HZH8_9MAGN|nr:hypothetical protein IFM89_023806 [Coptis chinensis]
MPMWRLSSSRRLVYINAKLRHFPSSLSNNNKLGLVISKRSIVTSCRAVVFPRFGGPEVLEIRSNVQIPDLKPHHVLVRARAVSINPLDTRMRAGYGRSIFGPLLPLILGRDVSGEVAAVGGSVRSLNVGQDVFGALHPTAARGTYADYAILNGEELKPKPSSVSHVEASAIPFSALTAWRALKSTARIAEGQRLLVLGGGGAVGLSAIQLSAAAGCRVATTCGGRSVNRVLEAGAEQAIDYTAEDIELAIKGQFDAVLDTIGVQETERVGINFLRRGGHYMTLQGEAASLSDRYGLLFGLPAATSISTLTTMSSIFRLRHYSRLLHTLKSQSHFHSVPKIPPTSPSLQRFLSTLGRQPTRSTKQNIGLRARQLQNRRLWTYALTFSCIAGFIIIVLNNFQDQLVFYVTPSEALEKFNANPSKNKFRLGGLVLENSVTQPVSSPEMEFIVTDLLTDILVKYQGSLPDLFREGHSVVVEGFIKPHNEESKDECASNGKKFAEKAMELGCYFSATDVLAKHDEKYMPQEVAAAIQRNKAKIEADNVLGMTKVGPESKEEDNAVKS